MTNEYLASLEKMLVDEGPLTDKEDGDYLFCDNTRDLTEIPDCVDLTDNDCAQLTGKPGEPEIVSIYVNLARTLIR